MSQNSSRTGSIVLGVCVGAIVGGILSFRRSVGPIAVVIMGSGLGAGFLLLFAFIPACTLLGAIVGGFIAHLLPRGGATDDRPPWSWAKFGIALGLIPVGFLCWWLGLSFAVFAGSSGQTTDAWIGLLAALIAIAGPFIGGVGVIWFFVIMFRRCEGE